MTTTTEALDVEAVMVVLAYATGALLNSGRQRSPMQVEDDRRMAARCWELAGHARRAIGLAIHSARFEGAAPRQVVAGNCMACGKPLAPDGRMFFCVACADRARREAMPLPTGPAEAVALQLAALLTQEQIADLYQLLGRRLAEPRR